MLKRSVAIALAALMATGAIAEPDELRQRSFAKAEYYFGAGGQPPTLAEFRSNPLQYLRHTMAYDALRQDAADKLREPALADAQSDFDFLMLLGRASTDTIDCVGQVHTAGISDAGATWQYDRDCYVKRDENGAVIEREQLVVAEDSYGEMHVLFSTWCLNPAVQQLVTSITTLHVVPVPHVETQPVPRSYPLPSETYRGQFVHVPDFNWCGCEIPGVTVLTPSTTIKRSRMGYPNDPFNGESQ